MGINVSTLRTRWAAIGAAIAVSIGAAGIGGYNLVSADISAGDRPVFVPINPCRLTDTRPAPNNVGPRLAPLSATETLTITAHGDNGECTGESTIPNDAIGLTMNVTALGATAQTFLTFWGEGDNPGTANLNPAPGQPPTPNAVNTPLSDTGTFNVFNNAGMVDVVIDVNGYYANHDHDDRYYTETEVDTLVAELEAARMPSEIVVSPQSFMAHDPAGDKWRTHPNLFHASSLPIECVHAAVPLPAGRTLRDVDVVMSAANGAILEVTFSALRAGPGPLDATTLIEVFDEDINTDPVAGETFGFTLFSDDSHAVLDGYTYSVELCTEDLVEVFALVFRLE